MLYMRVNNAYQGHIHLPIQDLIFKSILRYESFPNLFSTVISKDNITLPNKPIQKEEPYICITFITIFVLAS